MKKNIIVGQSGGPTAVINGSLYGVVSEGLKHMEETGHVYGMVNGIEGFLHDHYMDIGSLEATNELELVRTTPGAYLGSCRYKLPEDLGDSVYPELFKKFDEKNIGYFFYIGGNDSMDTVSKLSRYASKIDSDIRFIGVPKTIDNDLVETDHTPGYGSAAKYVATVVREIATDATVYDNKQSVTIVEVMGRHAGWLTAASMLARKFEGDNPVLIYLPEVAFNQDAFIEKVKEGLKTTPNLVVCISEGQKQYFAETSLGISASAKSPAEAKKFVEYAVSEEGQKRIKDMEDGFPVNEVSLDQVFKSEYAKSYEYAIENRDGKEVVVKAEGNIKKDDYRKWRKKVEEYKTPAFQDAVIREMVLNAAADYMNGNLELDAAVKQCARSIELYLNE